MLLILFVEDRNKASWILGDKVRDFEMLPGQDNLLLELDKLKVNFKKIDALIMLVKDASLTQLKVFTTTLNTLAWSFDLPTLGKFYFNEDKEQIINKSSREIAKIKKFKPIKVEYRRQAEITLSKKQPKYKIAK
ncbi:hypothetical protein KKH39_03110 [Patescibacteria group bacterium]|nr:hypothetical protein [Patescibacteria group bacterium]